MKINSFFNSARLFEKVTELNNDGQGSGSSQQNTEQNKEDKESQQYEVTEETVSKAIEAFAGDCSAKANQIKVEKVGTGPGLHVVLKDSQGNVIRQMSGKQFLQMSHSVGTEKNKSGKILDQKL